MKGIFLKNGNLVNVMTGEIYSSGLRLEGNIITGYEQQKGDRIIDCKGKYICPGFIESHIHLESTHILPQYSYMYFLQNGITTVVSDPHEIANAAGIKGIAFLMNNTKGLPVDYRFMIPSCVPASNLETSGYQIGIGDIKKLIEKHNVIGIAEMMNYPGVIDEDKQVTGKLKPFKGKVIDGHCPGLSGTDLDAYIRHGIYSDHEAFAVNEALEKMRKGMFVMIRRGSAADNLELIKIINKRNDRRFMLVSDDVSVVDMLSDNYLTNTLKRALQTNQKIDVISLIRGITINPAEYFRMHDRGIIATGKNADITILENVRNFRVHSVIKDGQFVYRNGRIFYKSKIKAVKSRKHMHIRTFKQEDFHIKQNSREFPVIKMIPDSLITDLEYINIVDESTLPDIKKDILLIAAIERYSGKSNYTVGLVKGLSLKKGAIASSYNHDAHNMLVVGTNRQDMAAAVNRLRDMGGGIVYVNEGKYAEVTFDIYGVMSSQKPDVLKKQVIYIENLLWKNGVNMRNPLTSLSFLSLSVIPRIKITDRGIVIDNVLNKYK